MPQTVTITSDAYDFDELSDEAKEKARDWYREGLYEVLDFDHMYDDFVRVGEILGIDFDQRETGQRRDGTKIYGPAILWTGFCSQGDGACFEGTYACKADASAKIREYAPKDEKLHRLADDLAAIQKRNAFGLRATTKHRGHYYHSRSMDIEVTDQRDEDRELGEDEKLLAECMVDFADWMYRQLEAENDYQYSDEAVDDTIEANEYKFNEDGSRHDYA